MGFLTNFTFAATYVYEDQTGWFLALIYFVILVVMFAAVWAVFDKASKPGWGALIPFYNTYLTIKIAGRPGWWLVLYFIPVVDIVIHFIVMHDLAKAFGKGVGYMLLLIFLPFLGWPLLAWGDASYKMGKKSRK